MIPRNLRDLAHSLHLLDDTPHRIALGMALGLLVAWTPTVGIQTFLVLPLAWLIGGNLVSSIVGIYLSNPLTLVPMYWLEYRLGALFLKDPPTMDEFTETIATLGWSDWGGIMNHVGWRLLWAMWIGGLILGAISAVPGYFLTHWTVVHWRARKNRLHATASHALSGDQRATKGVRSELTCGPRAETVRGE